MYDKEIVLPLWNRLFKYMYTENFTPKTENFIFYDIFLISAQKQSVGTH